MAITDSAGGVVEEYLYDIYGRAYVKPAAITGTWDDADYDSQTGLTTFTDDNVTLDGLKGALIVLNDSDSGDHQRLQFAIFDNPSAHTIRVAGDLSTLDGKPYKVIARAYAEVGSAIDNAILFQGRDYDAESGLYYFRNRQYDPVHGRFLSRDPAGYADSLCLYQFVNNNPVNYADPTGLGLKLVVNSGEESGHYHITSVPGSQFWWDDKINEPNDLTEVAQFLVRCVNAKKDRIDRLAFVGHGWVGQQAISKKRVVAAGDFEGFNHVTVDGKDHLIPGLFNPGASIEFYACLVAHGTDGRDFLRTVANNWLNWNGGSAYGYEGVLEYWSTIWGTWWVGEWDVSKMYRRCTETGEFKKAGGYGMDWIEYWSGLYNNDPNNSEVNWICVTVGASFKKINYENNGANKSEGVTTTGMP